MWEFPVISYNTYNNKIIQIKGVQVLLWEVRMEYNQVLLNGPQYFLLSFPYTKITLELWSSIYSDTLYVIIKRAVGKRKYLCNQLIILFYKALFFPKTLNMQIYKNQYVLIKSISVNPQLVWFYCLNKWRELLVPNISKNLPFVCDQCLSESQFSEHFYHHLHRSLVRYRNWGLKTISTGQISVHNLYSNDFLNIIYISILT